MFWKDKIFVLGNKVIFLDIAKPNSKQGFAAFGKDQEAGEVGRFSKKEVGRRFCGRFCPRVDSCHCLVCVGHAYIKVQHLRSLQPMESKKATKHEFSKEDSFISLRARTTTYAW